MSHQSAKAYKRYSSVIPSSHILDETKEVQPGRDKTETSAPDKSNGVQTSGGDVQKSTLVFGRLNHTVSSNSAGVPKVQLRTQRTKHMLRPISMPLERLPTPAQINDRLDQNTGDNVDGIPERNAITETIHETPEPERSRQSGSSRVSTYYITPFIDTQTMQRKAWDRKYKHYDVTPRTAMIVANLPPTSSGLQPIKTAVPITVGPNATTASVVSTTNSLTTVFSTNPYSVSVKPVWTSKREKQTENTGNESANSSNHRLTLRAPRTLQPPPGTFYKPPPSIHSKAGTLSNWTTTTATITTTTSTSQLLAPSNPAHVTSSLALTSSTQPQLQTHDSTDSGFDPGVLTSTSLSPQQSPPPSSPDDLSPSETKPIYQRLRPRLQELEHREAHFV